MLFFQSEARETLVSETARLHHVSRQRGGGVAAGGAGAEYGKDRGRTTRL